jgi:hypothetical protein
VGVYLEDWACGLGDCCDMLPVLGRLLKVSKPLSLPEVSCTGVGTCGCSSSRKPSPSSSKNALGSKEASSPRSSSSPNAASHNAVRSSSLTEGCTSAEGPCFDARLSTSTCDATVVVETAIPLPMELAKSSLVVPSSTFGRAGSADGSIEDSTCSVDLRSSGEIFDSSWACLSELSKLLKKSSVAD